MKLNNIQWNLTIYNETKQYTMKLNNIQWNWTIYNETEQYTMKLNNMQWNWTIYNDLPYTFPVFKVIPTGVIRRETPETSINVNR